MTIGSEPPFPFSFLFPPSDHLPYHRIQVDRIVSRSTRGRQDGPRGEKIGHLDGGGMACELSILPRCFPSVLSLVLSKSF